MHLVRTGETGPALRRKSFKIAIAASGATFRWVAGVNYVRNRKNPCFAPEILRNRIAFGTE